MTFEKATQQPCRPIPNVALMPNITYGVSGWIRFTDVTVDMPPGTRDCFAWRATVFSSLSPFVALYAPEDTDLLPHSTEIDAPKEVTTTAERCKAITSITFTFPGEIRWIHLFADKPKDSTILSDWYSTSLPVPQSNLVVNNRCKCAANFTNCVYCLKKNLGDKEPKQQKSLGAERPNYVGVLAERYALPEETVSVYKDASTSAVRKFIKAAQVITEAPIATDIQISWNPSFNGQQKLGVYSNLLFLVNVPGRGMNLDAYSDCSKRGANQWLGIYSLADTDNRAQQNPDSLINDIVYVRTIGWKGMDVGDYKPGFKVRPLLVEAKTGFEDAPFAEILNQVSSLTVQLPFVRGREFNQESPFTFLPLVGLETGRNIAGTLPAGVAQGIFRPVTGMDASLRLRNPHFDLFIGDKPTTFSGSFRVRFPQTDEVFITPTATKNILKPDSRPRLYGRVEYSVPLSKILAAAVVYQYGSLPPGFNFFGHTLSLTFKANSPVDAEH